MPLTTPRFWKGWVATLAAGIVFFAWIIRYTDQFQNVISLFSLGGILAWLTFFSKTLPQNVIEEMQTRIYEDYFKSGWAAKVGLAVIVLVALCGSFLGTIAVEAPTASRQVVWIRAPGESLGNSTPLPAGGEVFKQLVFTTPWGARERLVKVPGYPYSRQWIRPFQLTTIRFPDSLRERRVILLQPRPALALVRFREPRMLRVEVGGTKYDLPEYHGEPLWIGCMSDVDLPASLRRRLQREVAASFLGGDESDARREFGASVSDFWFSPQSIHDFTVGLNHHELKFPAAINPGEPLTVSMGLLGNKVTGEMRRYRTQKEKPYDFVELWWIESSSE